MSVAGPIRVLLADDHPFVLAGVRSLLAEVADIAVVGTASNGVDALRLCSELRPEVAVLDMSMPGLTGVAVARQLRGMGSACRVIALTVHERPSYLRQLIEIGMGGYVLKRSVAESLVQAIRAVRGGGIYLDPLIASQVVDPQRRWGASAWAGAAEPSAREIDVLRLTALGYSNKAIAEKLAIGVKTVETYKARAMEKLGFRSRVDVIRYAVDRDWLEVGRTE